MTNNDAFSQIGVYLVGKSERGTDCGRVIPGERWDTWYRSKDIEGKEPVQIRISRYGASPETWVEKTKVERIRERLQEPSKCVNISIVFLEESHDDSEDCPNERMCKDCFFHPCPLSKLVKPCEIEVLNGQNESGEPFTITEYRYHCEGLCGVHIRDIGDSIVDALSTGDYKDPLHKTNLILDYNHITNTDNGRVVMDFFTSLGMLDEEVGWGMKIVANEHISPYSIMWKHKKWNKYVIPYYKAIGKEPQPITSFKTYKEVDYFICAAIRYLESHDIMKFEVEFCVPIFSEADTIDTIYPDSL